MRSSSAAFANAWVMSRSRGPVGGTPVSTSVAEGGVRSSTMIPVGSNTKALPGSMVGVEGPDDTNRATTPMATKSTKALPSAARPHAKARDTPEKNRLMALCVDMGEVDCD